MVHFMRVLLQICSIVSLKVKGKRVTKAYVSNVSKLQYTMKLLKYFEIFYNCKLFLSQKYALYWSIFQNIEVFRLSRHIKKRGRNISSTNEEAYQFSVNDFYSLIGKDCLHHSIEEVFILTAYISSASLKLWNKNLWCPQFISQLSVRKPISGYLCITNIIELCEVLVSIFLWHQLAIKIQQNTHIYFVQLNSELSPFGDFKSRWMVTKAVFRVCAQVINRFGYVSMLRYNV